MDVAHLDFPDEVSLWTWKEKNNKIKMKEKVRWLVG